MENKNIYKDIPPLTTWQFFHAVRKVLGEAFLQKLYKKSPRQIYRWSANPDYCEDVEKNPLDRLIVLIKKLAEVGREDIALAALRILADILDCDVVPRSHPIPDKPTIADECLDDYPAIVAFHKAIEEEEPPNLVRYKLREAVKELEETMEKYIQDRGQG